MVKRPVSKLGLGPAHPVAGVIRSTARLTRPSCATPATAPQTIVSTAIWRASARAFTCLPRITAPPLGTHGMTSVRMLLLKCSNDTTKEGRWKAAPWPGHACADHTVARGLASRCTTRLYGGVHRPQWRDPKGDR